MKFSPKEAVRDSHSIGKNKQKRFLRGKYLLIKNKSRELLNYRSEQLKRTRCAISWLPFTTNLHNTVDTFYASNFTYLFTSFYDRPYVKKNLKQQHSHNTGKCSYH